MTEKPRHTPGPWEAHKYKGGKIAILHPLLNKGGEYDGKLGGYHVVVSENQSGNTGIDFKMTEANAALIAASPTMYDYISKMAKAGDGEAQAIIKTLDL